MGTVESKPTTKMVGQPGGGSAAAAAASFGISLPLRKQQQQSSGTGGSSSYTSFLWGNTKAYCDAAPPPPLPPLPPITGTNETTGSKQSSPPPPPPPPTGGEQPPPPPPPSTTTTPEDESIARAAQYAMTPPPFQNPGPYEHSTMDVRRLTNLDTHDGFRCDINKQLSPYMACVHSFWLGTAMLPDGKNKSYTFITQIADEAGFCMARFDPEKFSVDGRVHRAVLGGLGMIKIQFNTAAKEAAAAAGAPPGAAEQAQGSNDQLLGEIDFGGGTWTANLKYGSMGGGNVYGCNYFQQINNQWAAGGEGMYISANNGLMSNYTVKYSNKIIGGGTSAAKEDKDDLGLEDVVEKDDTDNDEGKYFMAANYNTGQGLLALSYHRTITPRRVVLAAELQCSPSSLDSQVTFGGEFQLQRSKMGVCVDGGGRIQSTLEVMLGMAPGSPKLTFAAEVDHAKDLMKFGYGLNIG